MCSEWQPIETAPKDGTPVLLFAEASIQHDSAPKPFVHAHQSALRALVAQWREEIGGDPLDRFDDGWVAAKGGCIEQLERLLSGPQP